MSDTKTNDDGFEPGQPVTFDQIQRAEAKRRMGAPKRENPDPKIPVTPEGIEKLKKPDLIELLKAHGVEKPEGKVDDMKARLKSVMFVDL